jgi:hypothetical protein
MSLLKILVDSAKMFDSRAFPRILGSWHATRSVPRVLDQRWNSFRVCSVCDEILSAYAQHKFTCKTFRVLPLAEHTREFAPRVIGVR